MRGGNGGAGSPPSRGLPAGRSISGDDGRTVGGAGKLRRSRARCPARRSRPWMCRKCVIGWPCASGTICISRVEFRASGGLGAEAKDA